MAATLVIRVSANTDPTLDDPLVLAEELMTLYDEYRRANPSNPPHDVDPLSEADLGAEFLEAEWDA